MLDPFFKKSSFENVTHLHQSHGYICNDPRHRISRDGRAENAFQALKQGFTNAPILIHVDLPKSFYLEADASDFGSISSQYGKDGRLHPIAFQSQKFSAVEINYEIYEKELLAIICAFKELQHFLKDTQHIVTIYTNYKNLVYFMSA